MADGDGGVRWLSVPGQPGRQVFGAEKCPQVWRWYHETYSICTIASGPAQWTYRGKELCTAPAETMLMEPGEVHDTRRLPHGSSTFRVALLGPALLADLAAEIGTRRPHLVGG